MSVCIYLTSYMCTYVAEREKEMYTQHYFQLPHLLLFLASPFLMHCLPGYAPLLNLSVFCFFFQLEHNCFTVALVPAVQRHESTIHIHIQIPLGPPSYPSPHPIHYEVDKLAFGYMSLPHILYMISSENHSSLEILSNPLDSLNSLIFCLNSLTFEIKT